MKLPVLFNIRDTEGHDRLIGRYGNRSNTKCICRHCDISFDDSDDPYAEFKLFTQKQIQRLIDKDDVEALREISMHCLDNAWKDIIFCDPKHGLLGACCGEVLHVLQHGMYPYVLEVLFGIKKIRKDKKKKAESKKGKPYLQKIKNLEKSV